MPSKIHLVSSRTPSAESHKVLIYFITGNPGLIEFYRPFLIRLEGILSSQRSEGFEIVSVPPFEYHVYGKSLAGFERDEEAKRLNYDRNAPFLVDEQIEHTEWSIYQAAVEVIGPSKNRNLRVILVGHSLGSYILLELLQKQRKRFERRSKGQILGCHDESMLKDIHYVGGINLFPTVTHIAESPKGKLLTPLLNLPLSPEISSAVAENVLPWLPTSVIQRLVSAYSQMPQWAAEVTTAYLKTPGAIAQTTYLARNEMITIAEDKWGDEFWSTEKTGDFEPPKLFFYFGKNDHWVADKTRDELISQRARRGGGPGEIGSPHMEIDPLNISHAFCFYHNNEIAEQTASYIRQIL